MARNPFYPPSHSRRGGQIRPLDQERVYDMVQAHDKFFGSDDSAGSSSPAGHQAIGVEDIPFFAMLVERDESDPWVWTGWYEQKLTTISEWWTDKKDGRIPPQNLPLKAYEINKETVPPGTIVLMYWSTSGQDNPIDRYLFEYQGVCWARLTARDNSDVGTKYAWIEVTQDSSGGWVNLSGGRTGNFNDATAYERNNIPDVPVGTEKGAIVMLTKGYYDGDLTSDPYDPNKQLWIFDYELYFLLMEITDVDNSELATVYSWKEKLWDPGSLEYSDRPGGRTGGPGDNPLYERNNKSDVPVGYIVWARPGAGADDTQDWVFAYELERFPARLDAVDNSGAHPIYSFTELLIDLETERVDGRTGDGESNPAYERNSLQVPIGSVVWMRAGNLTGTLTEPGFFADREYLFDYEPNRFWVRITDIDNSGAKTLYSATEVIPDSAGTWVDKVAGRTFAPTDHLLYSRSNKSDVQIGHIVPVAETFYGGSDEDREYMLGEETIEFPVELTAVDKTLGSYAWTEMLWALGGLFTVRPSGRTGTTTARPAYERNLKVDVPIGSIVYLQASKYNPAGTPNQEYNFDYELGDAPYYDTTTGTINNYALHGAHIYKWNGGNTDTTFTGLKPFAPFGDTSPNSVSRYLYADGQTILIENNSSGTGKLIFKHQNGSSDASNRINTPNSIDYTIPPCSTGMLVYNYNGNSSPSWKAVKYPGNKWLDGYIHTDTASADSAAGSIVQGSTASPSIWTPLAIGTAGYVLTVNAGGTQAEWSPGTPGPQGDPGNDGDPGMDGADGADGTNTITVEEDDSDPSYTDIDTLQVYAGSFVLDQPGTGIARIKIRFGSSIESIGTSAAGSSDLLPRLDHVHDLPVGAAMPGWIQNVLVYVDGSNTLQGSSSGVTPQTYPIFNDGITSGQLSSITINSLGQITAVTTV